MQTVLVIAYNRPHYLKDTLYHLAKVKGIENCIVYFQIDPFCQEVVAQCLEWSASEFSLEVNAQRLQCNGNVYRGLQRAFHYSDSVLTIEDDIIVDYDILDFIQPYKDKVVCLYVNHQDVPDKLDWNQSVITQTFNPWGWYCPKTIWKELNLLFHKSPNGTAWDTAMNRDYFKMRNPEVVRPYIGRTKNIGKIGTYCTSEELYYKHNYTKFWAGNLRT